MIIYFVNRNFEVLGLASTNLSQGYEIIDDELTQDIDSGVASLTATIAWSDATRLQLEEWTSAGNYLLTEYNDEAEMLTIITNETDTAEKAVTIYAEDAGLDLINEIAPAFTADSAHSIEWYTKHFIGDSDFEIGTNEIPDYQRTLSWDGESTVTERLRSVATQFDNAELSYSFAVENLEITHKYINIWIKRGTDAGQELRLNRDINSFRVTTSVEELYTGLAVTGGTPEGADAPITLVGYSYDDGDIYVDANGRLLSRKGAEEWGRLSKTNTNAYIMGVFTYETTSQSELCNRAIAYLRTHREPAVNYEVDIERGLEGAHIGDRVNLVDDKGSIYVSARILELKTSVTQHKKEATLGEYLIKSSGVSAKVLELANQFQQLAQGREIIYQELEDIRGDLGNNYQLLIATSYTEDSVVHTAILLQNGVDIADRYANDFVWSAKLTTGFERIGKGKTITIPKSDLHYGHAVTVEWTRREPAYLLTKNGDNLMISTGEKLMGRTEI